MDASLAGAEADLLRWGVLDRDDGLALSRRFRAALVRSAAALQAEGDAAASGFDALCRAAARALASHPLPEGGVAGPAHARFVAAVELASLPPAVLRALGVETD